MNLKYYHTEVSAKGRFVFLPVGRGLYVRTHHACLWVDCPDKACQAQAGEACVSLKKLETLGTRVYQSKSHPARGVAYRHFKAEQKQLGEDGKALKVVKGGTRKKTRTRKKKA